MKNLLSHSLILFVIGLVSCSTSNKKYPHALLTEDYGVLTAHDLRISEFQGYPEPFSERASPAYPYWQCFPTTQVTLKCCSWPDDKPGTFLGETDIEVNTGKEFHSYGFRRAWDIEFCKEHLHKWKELSKNEDALCLSGLYAGPEEKIIDGKKIKAKGWVWDRLKTKKGCDAFFDGYCTMDYWKKTYQPGCLLKIRALVRTV